MTQRVWDLEKITAAVQAEQYRALAELFDHDGEYEELSDGTDVDATRAALALRVTTNAASWQLRDAYQAVHLFPQSLEMLSIGEMPSTWFQRMLKKSRGLSDESRKKLDIVVSQWSMDITPERFHTLLKSLIELLRHREEIPDPATRIEKDVELLPGPEAGSASILVTGPIPDVIAQWRTLDETARAVQAAQRAALRESTEIPHDPEGVVAATGRALPLRELRFALLTSSQYDTEGTDVPAQRFRINLTVPALTLLGASDEPGTLDGTTLIPADMARSLAGDNPVWYRVLTEPARGAFLPLPADRFQPTAAMLEHLRLRNTTCAVPGCSRTTTWAAEADHIEECQRGNSDAGELTEVENLHLLCWQHHLDKTNGLIDPTRLPATPGQPGRTRWRIGTDGDVLTVIDDLDLASLRMAEDLETAWRNHLAGTPAGHPRAHLELAPQPAPEPRSRSGPADESGPAPGPGPDELPTEAPSPWRDPDRQRAIRPRDHSDPPPPIPPGPWGENGPPPF